jgi:hypothetical protein
MAAESDGRSVVSMSARPCILLVATLVALGGAAAPAQASLGGDVAAGQQVAAQLQSGQANCRSLSAGQFEHLGEYVMDRMVGSRPAHAAMNERMSRAVGAENTDRMHELMGRSFAGCAADGASGMPMGPGMMGGGYGSDWSGMMRSSAWGWMHSGDWRQMSPGDWRKLAGTMMGAPYTTAGDRGWSTAAVIAVTLGAVLVGAVLVLLLRRPWQRRPPGAPSTA